MNLNITLPPWLDMDQPAEAAIAAIVLFLAAGYFLRGRSEAPADVTAPHPTPAPAVTPPLKTPVEPVPEPPAESPVDPAFQTYLSFLSGIRDPAANSREAAERAVHWSD